MPPPQKKVADGQVDYLAVHAPLNTPLSFVSSSVVCCVHGNSVCLWNVDDGTREYMFTSAHSITRVCGNPAAGLLAYCEGGTSPQVFVYSVPSGGAPAKLLFTLSDTTELELADLTFSRDGSRLYTLSKATSKRLSIFSTKTGMKLKGCELDLPLRFDKVAVYPGHKDFLALVRTSSVRLVTINKSFETYICKLLPSAIPPDIDIAISAYAWTHSGQFLFATRQGLLATLDGATGQLLHACHTEQPITSIAVTAFHVATAHIGNSLRFWSYDSHQLPAPSEAEVGLPGAVPIDTSMVFNLEKIADLEGFDMNHPEEAVFGQVAYLHTLPDTDEALMTTAEGEVWMLQTPTRNEEVDDEGVVPDMTLTPASLHMRLLTWFHTHPISDLLFLGPSQFCASADEGGRLRIWPIQRNPETKGCAVIRFTSAITSIAADEQEGKLLLAGTDSGCLHCVDCSEWPQVPVVDTIRMSEAGVAKICCTRYEDTLSVAAALFNHKIVFLSVSLESCKVTVAGFVDVAGSVDDICYHTQDRSDPNAPPKLLAVGTSNEGQYSSLWAIRAPPQGFDPTTVDLKKDVCPMWSAKLSLGSKLGEKATAVASASKKTVVIGFASGALRSYAVPVAQGLPSSKQAVANILEEMPPHSQLVTSVRITRNGSWLVTASMDGVVRRASMEKGVGKELSKLIHNPYNGGALQVCAAADALTLMSTGGSDGIIVWSDTGAQVELPPPPEATELEVGQELGMVQDVDDMDFNMFPVWSPITEEQRAAAVSSQNLEGSVNPEVSAVATAHKKALAMEVEGLRKKVRMLVEDNAQCPDLEKLDRGEFCVDFEEKAKIAATTKERCDVLRAQIEKENLARQLIRDRLVKEFWDPMRGKGCQITSLVPGSTLAVSNYPERTVSEEEQGIRRKLRNLRQIEMLENQLLDSTDCPDVLRSDLLLKNSQFTTNKEAYIVNWWPAVAMSDGGKDVNIANNQLLYEPFELLTNSRRRLQIHLLQSHAASYRANFNELFKKCLDDKHGIIDQMKERIARIKGIQQELQIEEEARRQHVLREVDLEAVTEPELHDSEDADSVLKVKDREIMAEKWISEEEKRQMEEERAREEERQRQLRENDVGQRALAQMMGGTLKTKKDLSALEITLDREPWMDQIPFDDMTDLQKQALKEFEEKEKALAEEQEKYRKQLHAELASLRTQIEDLIKQFDEEHLKPLHQQHFIHDAKAFCQELYCVRMQLALLQSVEDQSVLEQSIRDVEESDIRLTEAETRLDSFKEKVADAREKQENLVQYERNVSSVHYFKQQFTQSNLEPEQVNSLLHLFRKRANKPAGEKPRQSEVSPEPNKDTDGSFRKSITRRETFRMTGSHGISAGPVAIPSFDPHQVMDPYADLGTTSDSSPASPHDDEVADERCPDGIDEANFRRMLDLRRDRYRAEQEVQKGRSVLDEMGGLLAHYQKEMDDAKNACEQLQAELEAHRQLMDRELYDIEILFKLKQGQVEVPQAAVVTDYSDAVVINCQVVESRNERIIALGKDKVGTLETTKEFRKKLNLIHWEHKMLAAKTSDLEERTKDVHMLRVTKDLQRLLKGGEESRNKAETEMLEKKIEHLNSTTAKKEQALRRQHAMNNHAAKLRKGENSMLEKKLRELQQNVIQREHIRRLRAPQGGGGGAATGEKGQKPRIVGGGGRIEENEAVIRTAQTSFREVKSRQSLMDAARKHTEEIEVLRKELDRLRQKTFPSFVQLHEDRPANPDHA